MCSQTVSQAVQLNRNRFLAAAIVVMVATASLRPARAAQLQPKQVAAKIHVAVDVDFVVGCSLANQSLAIGAQELGCLNIGESGKPVFEGKFLTFLGLHDGRLLRQ